MPRRRPSPPAATVAEERKRGQRLFGALLGTLSQRPQRRRAAAAGKRTDDAISPAQAQQPNGIAQATKDEILARRRQEQAVFDRQAMTLRHANMRAMANFLKTRTEPALYYKPWRLRPSQEDDIDDQLSDVEDLIRQEEKQSDTRMRNKPQADPLSVPEGPPRQDNADAHETIESANVTAAATPAESTADPAHTASETTTGGHRGDQSAVAATVREASKDAAAGGENAAVHDADDEIEAGTTEDMVLY
ncbi:hypothetical protein KEM52_006003 [Ascosphaera acerosa]|nr:hypothetical protein KEM52_006003 [Ascosphaera acerosa]